MNTRFITCLILASLSAFQIAHAGYGFGKDQHINVIEPIIEVPDFYENGEPVTDESGNVPLIGKLAYLTETQLVFAPVWVKDLGYVISGGKDEYYPLDESYKEMLEAYLGEALPKYELTTMDYVMGYLLWEILLIMGIFYGLKYFWVKRKLERESHPSHPST